MHKKLLKNLQTAQGMVEFALVLPILLLVILGIFAFGHMFFVYSSVVSASREAARWGSAVGEAPSTFPRYQDCDSIRAAAVRLGAFAGVNSSDIMAADDTGIEVAYDTGPDAGGGSTPYASCPEGGSGPSDVVMGDRIIVRVKVNYVPIVPIVDLPSFPLEATTYRTILRSVPVGEAPTAVDPCTSNTSIELLHNPVVSVVGQEVIYGVRVTAVEPRVNYPPTGEVTLRDDVTGINFFCTGTLVDETEHTATYTCGSKATYWEAGLRSVNIRYDSDDTCFLSSNTADSGDPTHLVEQAGTDLLLGVSPSVGQTGASLTVNVTAQAVLPGTGTPTGYVLVTYPGQAAMRVDLTSGSGSATFVPTSAGSFSIRVDYPEDADINYAAVTESINVTVLAPTPTFVSTPTNTPVPVIPTKTPLPDYCPRLDTGYNFFQVGSAIQLPIYNPNVPGSSKTNVTSVEIRWPGDPVARLQEIRWGTSVDSCSTGNGGTCLWNNATGLNPTHQVVNSSTAGWDSTYAEISKNESKLLRMVFNHSMPQGSYHMVIRFSANNCVLEIERDKVE